MWIRSQNKKLLLKIISISMTRNYGGNKRYALIGIGQNPSQNKVVGYFETEYKAMQELDKIQKELESGQTRVYQIS